MAAVELISRRALFGNPDRSNVRLSPNGEWIAYIAPDEGVLNVWVTPREHVERARPVTQDRGRGINYLFWGYTNRHICYLQDANGEENYRIFCVDLETGERLDLTPLEGVRAQVLSGSPDIPEEIVVGLNDRRPEWHDLYRVNITTGERILIFENDRFAQLIVDNGYRLRFGVEMTPDGSERILRIGESGGWEPWQTIPYEDTVTSGPLWLDRSGSALFVFDSRGRNTSVVRAWDLERGGSRVLAADERSDVQNVIWHPRERTIQGAAFCYERSRWEVVDKSVEADFAFLREYAEGDIGIAARTLDDRYWIVSYAGDERPLHYHLYERETGSVSFLFPAIDALEGKPLVKMRSQPIHSRDGLELIVYYSLPAGEGTGGKGKPARPHPTVFIPHGGPWYRDYWGFNAEHQWLANRGYAVLSVNFRSSTGLGKEFINAGDREWYAKIMDDQEDAVRWAVEEGIADPARVAVFGGSFGGYSVLAGLTRTPELFACGVDLAGPSNLVSLIESVPPYWKPEIERLLRRVGDLRTEEGRALLVAHSPLTHAGRIKRPLLIAQGANDPRVKRAESDQIVDSLRSKGIPVTYLLYPDEGHWFVRPQNRIAFYAIGEAFLAEHLGGRREAVGTDLEGSSVDVLEMSEEVRARLSSLR